MPGWALVLSYWLHMAAVLVWLGSVTALALLITPTAAKRLGISEQVELFEGVEARLESISWFCLFLIVATGLSQMSVNRNYHGLLRIENTWEAAIVAKIVLVIILAFITGMMSWGLTPKLQRAKIRYRRLGELGDMEALRHRQRRLLALQFGLTVLILLATAVARTASQ